MRDTVQKFPDADSGGISAIGVERTPVFLGKWGSRTREKELRNWWRHPYNWMVQGAFAGLINKLLATPWEVTGPKTGTNRARYFQDLFRDADFSDGWDMFWSRVWLDYLRQDGGAYIEIIAPGDPLKPPTTGKITGLAHLDSLYCYPTGNPEFPVIYWDMDGGRHKMHRDRVIHLVDMPDGDQRNPGYGLCALSRVIAHVEQMYYMARYNREQLDELPPPGFATLKNMSEDTFLAAVNKFVERKNRDVPPAYGNLVLLAGIKAEFAPEVEITSFSQAPEKFDYPAWVNMLYDAVAMGIGIDRQELAQLTGGNIGSGQQSVILHEKSQAKIYGHMLSLSTRKLNDVLPQSCEFAYKPKDAHESKSQADNAAVWVGVASQVAALIGGEQGKVIAAEILANQVEAVADAIIDENGQMVRLNDADVAPETDVTAGDATALTLDTGGGAATGEPVVLEAKDFAETAGAFTSAFEDLVGAAQDGDLNRRRAGTVLRANISRLGRAAYLDGMKSGGVEELSDDDLATIAVLTAQQSGYVTAFLDTLKATELTPAQVEQHATLWVNKSLTDFYNAGLLSANANGMYEWQLGATEDHCATCLRMNGQKHRLKEYHAKGILPKSNQLSCGGWQCDCSLVKTTGRAKGSW